MENNDLSLTITEVKVVQEGDDLFISGYANTVTKDRYGDIVLPSAFKMDNYEKNPILLLQHDHSKAIGKVVEHEITDRGLWIKAKISNAAEELYQVKTLILDEVLRALSIGFRMLSGKYLEEEDTYLITGLELLEISVVSVPANQDSIFEISKSFDAKKQLWKEEALALAEEEKATQTTVTTTETTSEETEKTVETVTIETTGDEIIPEEQDSSNDDNKSDSETEQKNTNTEKEEINMDEIQKAVDEALAKAETARLKAEQEAADEKAAQKVADEKDAAKITAAVETALALKLEAEEKDAGVSGRDVIETPTMQLSVEQERQYVKEVDNLWMLSIMQGTPMTELKAFIALPDQVKAVTNTAGTSLAPIGFDTRLMEDMRKILKVEPLFGNFKMPLADYRLPFNAAGVSAEWQVAGGTPSDQTAVFKSVLFTAKKLMSVVGFNYEDGDDSVVALLPTIRQELAYGMAELLETTLVVGAAAGNDFRGISDYAENAGASHISTITGGAAADFTAAAVAAARAKMGRYGIDPSKIVLLLNLQDYFKLVDDTNVATVDKFGPQATILKGQLAAVWGIAIIPTESIATPAATGDLRAVLVRPDRFKIGYRKSMMVEAWRDPRNQTHSLTASMRTDFNPLVPLTAGELASTETFVININVAA